MFLQDIQLWHRWALADLAWATCHGFYHWTTLLQQLSISCPVHTNLADFSGADEEQSHDRAIRALSTWIKPFLKWLFIPSRPNSTTQGLLQHFCLKELLCPLSGFFPTAWPLTYAIPLTNFWHWMLQKHFLERNIPGSDPWPGFQHSWKGRYLPAAPRWEQEAKNSLNSCWPWNTCTLKTQPMRQSDKSKHKHS